MKLEAVGLHGSHDLPKGPIHFQRLMVGTLVNYLLLKLQAEIK